MQDFTNSFLILYALLKKNRYDIEKQKIKLNLFSHNEYPSTKSLTDTLDFLDVKNHLLKIPLTAWNKIPKYSISILKDGSIALVKNNVKKEEFSVTYLNGSVNRKTYLEFNEETSSVFLLVESSLERVYRIKETIPLMLAVLSVVLIIFELTKSTLLEILLVILFTLGIVMAILIYKKEFNQSFSLLKFCSTTKKKDNCKEVFSSQNFIYNISFNEINISFFISSLYILLRFKHQGLAFIGMSLILSVLVIPYSLWIQKVISKSWCKLCLIVSSILLSSTIIMLVLKDFILFTFDWNFIHYLLIHILILFSVIWVVERVKEFTSLNNEEVKLHKWINDSIVYQSLLKKQEVINFDGVHFLNIGKNDTDKINITTVLSFQCNYCKELIEEIGQMIKNNNGITRNVSFNFLIYLKDKYSDEEYLKVNKLYLKSQSQSLSFDSFVEIFNSKKNTCESEDIYLNLLDENENWCIKNIVGTPTVFINDRELPRQYSVKNIVSILKNNYLFTD